MFRRYSQWPRHARGIPQRRLEVHYRCCPAGVAVPIMAKAVSDSIASSWIRWLDRDQRLPEVDPDQAP